jgi:excisionase family DNA binding protein
MVPRFDALEAMEFGRAVCACRLRGSETQAQLAARCSPAITEHRLSRLEHGRVLIRAVERAALLRALPGLDGRLQLVDPHAGVTKHAPRDTPTRDDVALVDLTPRVSRSTPFSALPDLLRVPETATYLDCSSGVVRSAITAGKLDAIRLGRLLRVRRSSLQEFLDGRGRDEVVA